MKISDQHPLYIAMKPVWDKMHDAEKSSRVKAAGVKYLPATESMTIDGMGEGEPGRRVYESYKMRAVYPTDFADSISFDIGMMHQKPAIINVPDEMKEMLDSITVDGENIHSLLVNINRAQLHKGRVGILLDFPSGEHKGKVSPYIALYDTSAILNWDDSQADNGASNLNLVVLNETFQKRNGFTWAEQIRYRVLQLGSMEDNEPEGTATYKCGVFDSDDYEESGIFEPNYMGRKLQRIPFVFANVSHTKAEPESPPKEDLVDACLSCYRGEADYRQVLHHQGQETLVMTNASGTNKVDDGNTVRLGAGSVIQLNQGGDAKFIGISGESLSELRKSVENDKDLISIKSGQKINTTQSSQESGEAIRTRVAARTANLISIAKTGAIALQQILEMAAEWMGYDKSKVEVKPNLEFTRTAFNIQYLVQLMTSKKLGAPISMESIHEYIKDAGLTVKDFADEITLCMEDTVKYKELLNVVKDANMDNNPQQQV